MWLLDYVTKNSFSKTQPSCGEVTSAKSNSVSVNASLEHREVPLLAPYGVVYNPPIKEQSVVLPLDSSSVCLGVIAPNVSLKPGELMLYSSGGASIVLKNSGEVLINGKAF